MASTPSCVSIPWSRFSIAVLRAPGQGIPVFSAGKGAGDSLLIHQFGKMLGRPLSSQDDLQKLWLDSISEDRIRKARVVTLGVPLDTGAGIRRGAMEGPRGVREALLQEQEWGAFLKSGEVLDLGDVFVNPHLLSDDMLSDAQSKTCQDEMYTALGEDERRALPVSALSQARVVLERVFEINPSIKPFVFGGDHSVAWPVSQALASRHPGALGILQSDAHTDLLSTRLGVRICFGTWSYHANDLIGRGGKMVQLGIRQSGRDRAHWESTTGVRQYWAAEILTRIAAGDVHGDAIIDELIAHFRARGVTKIYFSNDIDGTDAAWASSTGTPAEGGLSPDFLLRVIDRLGGEFEWVGSDIMEVAPPIGDSDSCRKTCGLGARYTVASLQALLR